MESFKGFEKLIPSRVVSNVRKGCLKNNLSNFEKLLDNSEDWEKVSFGPIEKWINKNDNSVTIEISQTSREFSEYWTDKFPDRTAYASEVYLKIGGELVCPAILFVLVDGAKNFVPCPRFLIEEGYYYWDKNSLEFKVFKIIGELDLLYKQSSGILDINDFALRAGVTLTSL